MRESERARELSVTRAGRGSSASLPGKRLGGRRRSRRGLDLRVVNGVILGTLR